MNNSEAIKIRDTLLRDLSSGKIEDGIAYFKQKSTELPEVFRLECLGNISFYQRNIGEAIKFYEAATLHSPEHVIPRYLYLAGVKNEQERNFVDAFKYYQAAIEADPSFVDSYVELGGLLTKIEDWEGALKCYQDAARLDSHEVSNHHNLEMVLTKLNQNHPGLYEEKLQAAKVAHEQIARISKSDQMSQRHQW